MGAPFPLSVQPYLLAKKQARLTGELSVSRMPRLYKACTPLHEAVRVAIEFLEYQDDIAQAQITLRTELVLQCCRCLEDIQQEMSIKKCLLIAHSEKSIHNIGDDNDLILCEDNRLDTALLIEDELLLQLPQFPVHQNTSQCSSAMLRHIGHFQEKATPHNPFSILKEL